MADLLSLVLPIFLLIGLGFAAVRSGFMQPAHVEGLAFFVLNFALPALILHALSEQDLRETFNGNYLIGYAAGSLATFGLALAFFRVALRKPLSHAAIGALGCSSSNSGFIGFPVASLALGGSALVALPLSMLVENILIIPLALALAEAGLQRGQSPRHVIAQTARRLSRMPLILAILVGGILSAAGLTLPDPLARSIDMIAAASAPCALFVIGGTLATLNAKGVAGDVLWITLGKLALHPLAVTAAFFVVGGIPAELWAAGIIMASVPMLTVYPILGGRFGMGGVCAAALMVATVAGFLTITLVLAIVLGRV